MSAPADPVSRARAHQLGLDGAAGWSRAGTFWRGALIAVRVPGAVLFASSIGYGALARDTGLDLAMTLFIHATIFAMPAQVLLVDQIARGSALAAAAFAVSLTAIRFLPMTVSIIPLLRDGERLPRFGFLATHFVAISVWVEGQVRLPLLPRSLRFTYFTGMGTGMLIATLCGTVAGFLLAQSVPPTIGAVLLFMPPAFFLLSLIGNARQTADWLAIGCGALFGPVLYLYFPGFDLLLTGLAGGTIAFLVRKFAR